MPGYMRPSSKSSQDAETGRQRRSRIAQRLTVRRRVRFVSSLAAALLDDLFEYPAGSLQLSRIRRLLCV
jgi:hypothetical protein